MILFCVGASVHAQYVAEGCVGYFIVENGRVYAPSRDGCRDPKNCDQKMQDLNRKVIDIGGGKMVMQYNYDGKEYSTVLCEKSRSSECGCRFN